MPKKRQPKAKDVELQEEELKIKVLQIMQLLLDFMQLPEAKTPGAAVKAFDNCAAAIIAAIRKHDGSTVTQALNNLPDWLKGFPPLPLPGSAPFPASEITPTIITWPYTINTDGHSRIWKKQLGSATELDGVFEVYQSVHRGMTTQFTLLASVSAATLPDNVRYMAEELVKASEK